MKVDSDIDRQIDCILKGGDRIADKIRTEHGHLTDVIETYHREKNHVERLSRNANLYNLILNWLGHISVNPSKPINSRLIRKSYVYTGNDDAEGVSAVNQDPATARSFLDKLIEASKKELVRSTEFSENQSPESYQLGNFNQTFILTGERGVGKSFFLNHMLSEYVNYLDENNVIWIRINLVAQHMFDNDVIGWVHAQVAKVLLRYYDESSDYATRSPRLKHGFYHYLYSWLEEQGEVIGRNKQDLLEKLMRMHSAFCKRGSDEDISPALCSSPICQELYRYARLERKLSFIVVFDGFDRLDRDMLQRARFRQLEQQLQPLMVNKPAHGAVFVFVTRNGTFDSLLASHPYRNVESQRFRIQSPEFDKILDRRLDALDEWLSDNVDDGIDPQHKYRACETLRNFRSDVNMKRADGDYSSTMEALGCNNRARAQVIQLYFQEFCQRKQKFGYRLIEHMVKAGFVFPPVSYRHEVVDDRIEATSTGEFFYDSRFLPLLSRPPVPSRKGGRDELDNRYYSIEAILLQVRILQILTLWSDTVRENSNLGNLTIGEISDAMQILFRFDEKIVRSCVYELECFEVLSIRRESAFGNDSEFDTMSLLSKTKHLLDRIIFDIAYLNLCGMRLLVPIGFLKECELLKVATLPRASDNERKGRRIRRWIAAKITNSLIVAALVLAVNRKQEEAFMQKTFDDLPLRIRSYLSFSKSRSIFRHFDRMPGEISREIGNIANSPDGDVMDRQEVGALLSHILTSIDSLSYS